MTMINIDKDSLEGLLSSIAGIRDDLNELQDDIENILDDAEEEAKEEKEDVKPKFKAGDKVKVINTYRWSHFLKIGSIATVKSVRSDGSYYCEGASRTHCETVLQIVCEDDLELYEDKEEKVKHKFKIGQKAKVVKQGVHNFKVGSVVTVEGYRPDYGDPDYICRGELPWGENTQIVYEKDLEALPEEEAEMAGELKSEFKVGAKVRVKSDLERGCYGNDTVVEEMLQYLNKKATITRELENDEFELDIDNGEWHWTPEMLEEVKEFKVGAKVRVKENIKLGDVCFRATTVVDDMLQFAGEKAKITAVDKLNNGEIKIHLDITDGDDWFSTYFWGKDQLELI